MGVASGSGGVVEEELIVMEIEQISGGKENVHYAKELDQAPGEYHIQI